MKPHARIRKTIKWGGAAVTVLLVVVWVTSAWWTLWWYEPSGFGIAVTKGLLRAMQNKQPSTLPGLHFQFLPLGFSLDWRYTYLNSFRPKFWLVEVPLWPAPLVSFAATAVGWICDGVARRRAKSNRCPKCGYDRTGLASADAKCPECGAAPAGV